MNGHDEGREVKLIFPVHPGDWTEDFDHENGNYIGICKECGHSFRGHKRRFICKICMQPDWENIATIKKPNDVDRSPFAGCWSEGEMVGYAKCMITKVRELTKQLQKERELRKELYQATYDWTNHMELWIEEAKFRIDSADLEDLKALIQQGEKAIQKAKGT